MTNRRYPNITTKCHKLQRNRKTTKTKSVFYRVLEGCHQKGSFITFNFSILFKVSEDNGVWTLNMDNNGQSLVKINFF
jgi:hypothetical protein